MAEWLYEAGIGENRAALIEGGAIVEVLIEREQAGPEPGDVCDAVLRARGIAELADGCEVLLDAVPPRAPEGTRLRLLITREALPEPGKPKRAKGRAVASDLPLAEGPRLLGRIRSSGLPLRELQPRGSDALEAAGWSETLEQAASGIVAFGDNTLSISLTPAMTLIDIDGPEADSLHSEAARAAALAIRRLGIAGNIGIDFPTTGSKQLRAAAAAALKATLPRPYETTAINGFGFLQVIRPRWRASLLELMQYDRTGSAACALLRQAQRSGLVGAVEIAAHPSVARVIEARPAWLAALGQQLGGRASLRADGSLGIGSGYVSSAR